MWSETEQKRERNEAFLEVFSARDIIESQNMNLIVERTETYAQFKVNEIFITIFSKLLIFTWMKFGIWICDFATWIF